MPERIMPMLALSHDLGALPLDCGQVLTDAKLVYATFGALNSAGDNAILIPSYYSGTHDSYARWIGPTRAIDPERYFIVCTNMLGNGVSSSPSNHPLGGTFPAVTIADNIRAQHDLLAHLGVSRLQLVAGWSLGAMQALHWAMLYPEMVRRVMALCGTAFCWPLNGVFLAGMAPLLEAGISPSGLSEAAALRMFGRAYAGWAYSAEFFRQRVYQQLGFADVDALLLWWEQDHLEHRAADLLAVLNTWRAAAVPAADARAAMLGRITADCLIMPCDTDVYFTLAEAGIEAALIKQARVVPLQSPCGHCAGAPGRFPNESKFIESRMASLLNEPP
jgi:homoserine O-acetyltransferase